jgi:hypothetical protein
LWFAPPASGVAAFLMGCNRGAMRWPSGLGSSCAACASGAGMARAMYSFNVHCRERGAGSAGARSAARLRPEGSCWGGPSPSSECSPAYSWCLSPHRRDHRAAHLGRPTFSSRVRLGGSEVPEQLVSVEFGGLCRLAGLFSTGENLRGLRPSPRPLRWLIMIGQAVGGHGRW